MRQLSEAFAARLAANTTTLCTCWRFERSDGAAFGATDHDRPLEVDGTNFLPSAGLESATFHGASGLAPGQAAASGAVSLDFMTAADIDAGLWDGARVDVWRVDWQDVAHRVMIWSGRLSEVTRQGAAFSAELVSIKAGLERRIGRAYTRTCDAEVGDARCGVDLGAPAYRAEGEVTAVVGPSRFTADGIDSFAAGWFAGGVLTWSGGANAGRSARVLRHAGNDIELAGAPRHALTAGDGFVVTAGCDKSFAACGSRSSNRINYRGFPHMPGPEAMLAGPASDRANDGGRRE